VWLRVGVTLPTCIKALRGPSSNDDYLRYFKEFWSTDWLTDLLIPAFLAVTAAVCTVPRRQQPYRATRTKRLRISRVIAATACRFRRRGNVDRNLVASACRSAAGRRRISAASASPWRGWSRREPLHQGSPAHNNNTTTYLLILILLFDIVSALVANKLRFGQLKLYTLANTNTNPNTNPNVHKT